MKNLLFHLTLSFSALCHGQQFTDLYGDYLGQTPPGDTPVIFAPETISGYVHGPIAISSVGDEIYWVINTSSDRILYSKRINGRWSKPEIAEFINDYLSNNNGHPAFTHKGDMLFFYSDRPGGRGSIDAWYVKKKDNGWSNAINAGEPYNSAETDFTPLFTNIGNAYNLRMNAVTHTTSPISFRYSGDGFTDPSSMDFLPEYSPWWSIYISPEEDYLIFAGGENSDLFIRFKNNTGKWGNPVSMGKNINTAQWERFPYVSPDGKYLFFTRGNDVNNLFWVSTSIIDSLKTTLSLSFDLPFTDLYGDYLGQTPPGDTPVVFTPGIISGSSLEHSAAVFSIDGNEVYWASRKDQADKITMWNMKRINNRWTQPQAFEPFPDSSGCYDPFFANDNKRLYFAADGRSSDIYYVDRDKNRWGKPQNISTLINNDNGQCQATLTKDGTLYYIDYKTVNDKWTCDIMQSKLVNGSYTDPVSLPSAINSSYEDWTPFIAPDDSFIIFGASGDRKTNFSSYCDLYISFHDIKNNTWSEPINMGPSINTMSQETYPVISPDGKYLFFTRWTDDKTDMDVYWVSTKIIDKLREEQEKSIIN